MNKSLEQKFLQALERCQALVKVKCKPSNLPCEAIEIFSEIGNYPEYLISLIEKYETEVESAEKAVESYARSIDNWQLEGGRCPFGVKDHCNILHFFLNLKSQDFNFFRGKNWTPEVICEFLQEWKSINLSELLKNPQRDAVKL
jgi:hypothetical protein